MILTVYFSHKGETYFPDGIKTVSKGNTEIAAEYIHKAVGGDLFEIVTAKPYSEEYRKNWDENCFVIKEYTFAFEIKEDTIELSKEHSEYKWGTYEEVISLLKYDSNKTALTELRARINKKSFK